LLFLFYLFFILKRSTLPAAELLGATQGMCHQAVYFGTDVIWEVTVGLALPRPCITDNTVILFTNELTAMERETSISTMLRLEYVNQKNVD